MTCFRQQLGLSVGNISSRFIIHLLQCRFIIYVASFCVTVSELESIKALFNDKEKELAMAVTKVETLSQQLDSLQKADASVMTTNKAQAPIIIELEKLRNELRVSPPDLVFHSAQIC